MTLSLPSQAISSLSSGPGTSLFNIGQSFYGLTSPPFQTASRLSTSTGLNISGLPVLTATPHSSVANSFPSVSSSNHTGSSQSSISEISTDITPGGVRELFSTSSFERILTLPVTDSSAASNITVTVPCTHSSTIADTATTTTFILTNGVGFGLGCLELTGFTGESTFLHGTQATAATTPDKGMLRSSIAPTCRLSPSEASMETTPCTSVASATAAILIPATSTRANSMPSTFLSGSVGSCVSASELSVPIISSFPTATSTVATAVTPVISYPGPSNFTPNQASVGPSSNLMNATNTHLSTSSIFLVPCSASRASVSLSPTQPNSAALSAEQASIGSAGYSALPSIGTYSAGARAFDTTNPLLPRVSIFSPGLCQPPMESCTAADATLSPTKRFISLPNCSTNSHLSMNPGSFLSLVQTNSPDLLPTVLQHNQLGNSRILAIQQPSAATFMEVSSSSNSITSTTTSTTASSASSLVREHVELGASSGNSSLVVIPNSSARSNIGTRSPSHPEQFSMPVTSFDSFTIYPSFLSSQQPSTTNHPSRMTANAKVIDGNCCSGQSSEIVLMPITSSHSNMGTPCTALSATISSHPPLLEPFSVPVSNNTHSTVSTFMLPSSDDRFHTLTDTTIPTTLMLQSKSVSDSSSTESMITPVTFVTSGQVGQFTFSNFVCIFFVN
ncbi:unnamed protein product [Protopolystoma xenopodis]|uniref:Uncharacterized protein n=1 Tax=Protopolystoma xenopodis TaxID=117903 RepID=A0A3S5A987_9PLAT|nr:unnamed protein product [Protopolystoma xenopodis]